MQFPRIEFSTSAKKGDGLVLGLFQDHPEKNLGTDEGKKKSPQLLYIGKRSKEVEVLIGHLKQSKHFKAKKNEVDLLRYYSFGDFPSVLLLGLGASKQWNPEMARQAGAAVRLAQKRALLDHLIVQSDSIFGKVAEKDLPIFLQAFSEGYWMAGHEFTELKKREVENFVPHGIAFMGPKENTSEEAVKRALIVARAVCLARTLGDRPANFMTPSDLAKESQRAAKEVGMKCTVLGKPEIQKEKMGLLLGVAKGSHEEPRFIVLEYQGAKKTDKPIALVGKGVTFDSGGISLKPAHQMEDMKYDMMGAAAVVAICQAAAALKLPVNVTGFIAATENMPSGSSQKPGDVAKSISGKTVEITNTDAEGRLILADALEYAQKYHPQAIIDFATLTGAVVVALGTLSSGIIGNHRGLIERVKDASAATGERVWELPLYEEYEEDLKSHYADIKNSGVRDAGSSKGGTFLKFFIDPKFPWVHCDIAGSAYHRKDVNYHPSKYASGVMVRLAIHLLENWKPLS